MTVDYISFFQLLYISQVIVRSVCNYWLVRYRLFEYRTNFRYL